MGKSEVVKWIIQSFKVGGKTVGVICLSGIACQVYDHGWALTIHSFYGLSMADLPWRQLEDRSAGNSLIQDRIKVLDAVIWDEASKSSRRMFEVIRFLNQKLATNEFNKALPFAGKQVTLVGEFLQFQPVPNLLNEGEFMFYSPLFNLSIPHHFDLTKIMHQLEVSAIIKQTGAWCITWWFSNLPGSIWKWLVQEHELARNISPAIKAWLYRVMLVGNLNNNLKKGFLCIFFWLPFKKLAWLRFKGKLG